MQGRYIFLYIINSMYGNFDSVNSVFSSTFRVEVSRSGLDGSLHYQAIIHLIAKCAPQRTLLQVPSFPILQGCWSALKKELNNQDSYLVAGLVVIFLLEVSYTAFVISIVVTIIIIVIIAIAITFVIIAIVVIIIVVSMHASATSDHTVVIIVVVLIVNSSCIIFSSSSSCIIVIIIVIIIVVVALLKRGQNPSLTVYLPIYSAGGVCSHSHHHTVEIWLQQSGSCLKSYDSNVWIACDL